MILGVGAKNYFFRNIYKEVRISYFMEITKLSTKGQIVIPENLRKGLQAGTPFIVSRQEGLIVLKEVKDLTKQEVEEMKELDKIWKDIDGGKGTTTSVEEFLKEMKTW